MSQAGWARYLGISERTARRYARDETEIPEPHVLLLRAMIHDNEVPVVPLRNQDQN